MSSQFSQYRWNNLVRWLAQKGMKTGPNDLPVECRETPGAGIGLFTVKGCKPSSVLFKIPATALINVKTLRPIYPGNTLTAIQLISLHLFLHQPCGEVEDSSDPHFGPYISILPRNFDSHPLTWLVQSSSDYHRALLNSLPPSVLTALRGLHERFLQDWTAVRAYMQHELPGMVANSVNYEAKAKNSETSGYLLAWLNVNTRCIYRRLKSSKSDPDNVTMCPILDFANHHPHRQNFVPAPTDADMWDVAPTKKLGDDFKFVAVDDGAIDAGSELFLMYGHHSNRTLFTEYGFINRFEENSEDDSPPVETFGGEVDVQDVVEELMKSNLTRQTDLLQRHLQEAGYWGDWTLHSAPHPAHPSYRFITVMRLAASALAPNQATEADIIDAWQEVIAGKRDVISAENEEKWRILAVRICDEVVQRSEARMREYGECLRIVMSSEQRCQWVEDNVKALWHEESYVATLVKGSILSGDML